MSFLIFFLALSLMIFAHELGHFLVAKKRGVRVEEFGFGFPPRIWGKKIGETIYSINLLPLGGFVRVWGMEEKVKTDKKRAFYNQSTKTQALILVAGVVMNFLVSIMVFGSIYGFKGIPEKINKVKILEVMPDSPAEKAGIGKDSLIVKITYGEKEVAVESNKEFIENVDHWLGEEITLISDRGEEYHLTPRKDPPEGEGALGVIITDSQLTKPVLWKRVPLGIYYGFKEGIFWGKNIAAGVGGMMIGIFKGKAPTDVAGPIGIYKVSSEILKHDGLLSVIHFFAVVSVNLVIVNLLPLPGTDGWHISLLSFEKIRGKEISRESKRKINQIGMSILLALFFLIIIADIKRFIL